MSLRSRGCVLEFARGSAEIPRGHAIEPQGLQPSTLNPEPNSTRNPLPSLGNNTTLENIDGAMVIPRIVLVMRK